MIKLKNILILLGFITLNVSCIRDRTCVVTDDTIYISTGIKDRLVIQLIKVSTFDEQGIPKEYEEDTVRVDFINESSKRIKTIKLFSANPSSVWQYKFSGRFEVFPISFVSGRWYLISSGEFKYGIFNTNNFEFYVFKDHLGSFTIHKKYFGSNFL